MENRSLQQPERRHWNCRPSRQQSRKVAIDSQLDILQRLFRFFTQARKHIEGDLRVVHVVWQFLEAEQRDTLLLQFVEPALSTLAHRLVDFDDASPDRSRLAQL